MAIDEAGKDVLTADILHERFLSRCQVAGLLRVVADVGDLAVFHEHALGEFGRFARSVLGGEELAIGEECACWSHFRFRLPFSLLFLFRTARGYWKIEVCACTMVVGKAKTRV